MSFRTFIAVGVIPALLIGCGDSTTPELNRNESNFYTEKNGPTVTGIASAGAPLVGVVISATDRQGDVIESTVTDATGRYFLRLKNRHSYVLTTPFNDVDGSPALLSSVYAFNSNFSASINQIAQANINPLTSLITSRVLGMIPTSSLTGDQIKNAIITPATVLKAEQEIATLFKPLYKVLAIPDSEADDPVGSRTYQAKSSDPLENLFTVARFKVRTGEVSIGTGVDRFVIPVSATGALLQDIPKASVDSLAILHASQTRTPIKHLIVVIGENQTFDAIFGAYQAPASQIVRNLISQGIINADGTLGPNSSLAKQNQAVAQTTYTINPTRSMAYETLPQPRLMEAIIFPSLTPKGGVLDQRYDNQPLQNGPFQLTKYVPYVATNPIGATTGDPAHRFFQMWQQTGGTNANLDMYTWVAVNAGQGGDTPGVTPSNPAQGAELMGFLNMNSGDAPYWNSLAQQYALSDNYHQSILGGSGINFYAIATADVPYFNVNGKVAVPPLNQIENPNPMLGTTNFYMQDGFQGGSYVNCSDATQPGVAPILDALAAAMVQSKCEAGKYYLVNNYGLAYDLNGNAQPIGPNNYTLPPQTAPTIAEALTNKGVSWKWYTGGREIADVLPTATLFGVSTSFAQSLLYNAVGDPLVASQNIMTSPSLKAGLAGLTTFFNDIKPENNSLPAVSFVVPMSLDSGHPGFSVQGKYEDFVKKLIKEVQKNRSLWDSTAILITTDEGGGYFDTGYIQMQDFFGDGPRIPMLVVSPYARKNHIDHSYHDHASVLKFIQRNWKLNPLSSRSRDNHPNPVTTSANLYKPINKTPTVGDLMTMFEF